MSISRFSSVQKYYFASAVSMHFGEQVTLMPCGSGYHHRQTTQRARTPVHFRVGCSVQQGGRGKGRAQADVLWVEFGFTGDVDRESCVAALCARTRGPYRSRHISRRTLIRVAVLRLRTLMNLPNLFLCVS